MLAIKSCVALRMKVLIVVLVLRSQLLQSNEFGGFIVACSPWLCAMAVVVCCVVLFATGLVDCRGECDVTAGQVTAALGAWLTALAAESLATESLAIKALSS